MDIEGENPKVEIGKEIRRLQRENEALRIAVEEGDIVAQELKGRFWALINRTFDFLEQSYKEEAYEAAKVPGLSPQFYLGRMANLDDLRTIITNNFVQGKDQAIARREANEFRIKELNDILDNKEKPGYNGAAG